MASRIRPVKNGVLTSRGWVHERTGEVLKAMKVTPAMLDEYYSAATSNVVQTVTAKLTTAESCPCGNPNCAYPNCECGPDCDCEPHGKNMSKMTKKELAALAEAEGIEVNTKETKKSLLSKLTGLLNIK